MSLYTLLAFWYKAEDSIKWCSSSLKGIQNWLLKPLCPQICMLNSLCAEYVYKALSTWEFLWLNCHKYLWIQVIKVAFQILDFIQVMTPNGNCIWKLEFDKRVFSPIFYLSCLYWLWAVCCKGCLLLNNSTLPGTIKPRLFFPEVSKHHCNVNK